MSARYVRQRAVDLPWGNAEAPVYGQDPPGGGARARVSHSVRVGSKRRERMGEVGWQGGATEVRVSKGRPRRVRVPGGVLERIVAEVEALAL